uniref:Uncharacterized protein n=1 Tax=Panagrolaimus sp. JU765 TaxID=591449 RepID=A0AC34RE83_9BILA
MTTYASLLEFEDYKPIEMDGNPVLPDTIDEIQRLEDVDELPNYAGHDPRSHVGIKNINLEEMLLNLYDSKKRVDIIQETLQCCGLDGPEDWIKNFSGDLRGMIGMQTKDFLWWTLDERRVDVPESCCVNGYDEKCTLNGYKYTGIDSFSYRAQNGCWKIIIFFAKKFSLNFSGDLRGMIGMQTKDFLWWTLDERRVDVPESCCVNGYDEKCTLNGYKYTGIDSFSYRAQNGCWNIIIFFAKKFSLFVSCSLLIFQIITILRNFWIFLMIEKKRQIEREKFCQDYANFLRNDYFDLERQQEFDYGAVIDDEKTRLLAPKNSISEIKTDKTQKSTSEKTILTKFKIFRKETEKNVKNVQILTTKFKIGDFDENENSEKNRIKAGKCSIWTKLRLESEKEISWEMDKESIGGWF